jgi:competence protein ComFC
VSRAGLLRASEWARLFELIAFPSFCRICGRLLENSGERVVCAACWKSIRPSRAALCPSCGRFFEGAGGSHYCGECLASRPVVSVHRSCGAYEGTLKDLILLFKYRGMSVLGPGLAGLAVGALGGDDELWWGVDALVPVPLHPRRKRERGFNQSAVLARELGKAMGPRVLDGVLIKERPTPAQTSLKSAERASNLRGAYRVKREDKVRGKVVMLVDDVYTTGSTIRECGRTLVAAGAKEVRAITLARA